MNDNLRKSLSALMDGEADELELRQLLSSEHNEDVNDLWSRYHLVRDALHNDQHSVAFQQMDISQQVSAAIAQDSTVMSGIEEPSSTIADLQAPASWWRPVAGFAVAASVAMVVVVGVQSVSPLDSSGSQQPIATSAKSYPSFIQNTGVESIQASAVLADQSSDVLPHGIAASRAAADIEARKRLEEYMLRHTESAALNNGQSMIPFARVTNFEEE